MASSMNSTHDPGECCTTTCIYRVSMPPPFCHASPIAVTTPPKALIKLHSHPFRTVSVGGLVGPGSRRSQLHTVLVMRHVMPHPVGAPDSQGVLALRLPRSHPVRGCCYLAARVAHLPAARLPAASATTPLCAETHRAAPVSA